MRSLKSIILLTAVGLVLSCAGTAWAQSSCRGALTSGEVSRLKISPAMLAQIKNQLMLFTLSILKVDPQIALKDKKIQADEIFDLGERGATAQEIQLLAEMTKLVDSHHLEPVLNQIFQSLQAQAKNIPQLQKLEALTDQQRQYVFGQLSAAIQGIVRLRGMTADSKNVRYTEWPELSRIMTAKIDKAPKGLDSFLHFTKSKWLRTEAVEVLVDGKASFAQRDRLIGEAAKSIDVLTWSIYDDMTGFQAVDLLIQKKQQGIAVRVIVDGQVAATSGHSEAVKKLEQSGIPVIRWFNPERQFEGQHRKMLIVDNEHVIAGGLNFGDVYSHKNPDPKVAKWRDTDVYLKGNAAIEAQNQFAEIWNEQIIKNKLNLESARTLQVASAASAGRTLVSIITNDPAQALEGSSIMLTLLKAIRNAKSSVDIENAYIVLFPALKQEITAAIQRKVEVRIFTNSDVSVDEPIVSVPILRSAQDLVQLGAKVFLKKGDTLHSKLALIDRQYSMIMSYNLHPRSERIEGEMAVVVNNKAFAEKMRSVVDQDLMPDKATAIQTADQIKIPESATALPVLRLFFDLL